MGNIGRIVKNDCPNPHTNPSTSISMCHIYHQRSIDKNASSDDKCGIEILMPNTKFARISLERTSLTSTINLILNSLHSFWYGINSLTTEFSMFRIYCNEIFLLYKPIVSKSITTACNNYFVVSITPYCNEFVVIATISSFVIDLFPCSVMCLNRVKYRHVNS